MSGGRDSPSSYRPAPPLDDDPPRNDADSRQWHTPYGNGRPRYSHGGGRGGGTGGWRQPDSQRGGHNVDRRWTGSSSHIASGSKKK
jgi:hypothetical protein